MKSDDPNSVPAMVKVYLGDLGPALAAAAKKNNRTLAAEIRERLKQTMELDPECLATSNQPPANHEKPML